MEAPQLGNHPMQENSDRRWFDAKDSRHRVGGLVLEVIQIGNLPFTHAEPPQQAAHFLIAGPPIDLDHRVSRRRLPEPEPSGERLAALIVRRATCDHAIEVSFELRFFGRRGRGGPQLGQRVLQDLLGDSGILCEHQAELVRRACQQPHVSLEPRTVSVAQRFLLVHLYYERRRPGVYAIMNPAAGHEFRQAAALRALLRHASATELGCTILFGLAECGFWALVTSIGWALRDFLPCGLSRYPCLQEETVVARHTLAAIGFSVWLAVNVVALLIFLLNRRRPGAILLAGVQLVDVAITLVTGLMHFLQSGLPSGPDWWSGSAMAIVTLILLYRLYRVAGSHAGRAAS